MKSNLCPSQQGSGIPTVRSNYIRRTRDLKFMTKKREPSNIPKSGRVKFSVLSNLFLQNVQLSARVCEGSQSTEVLHTGKFGGLLRISTLTTTLVTFRIFLGSDALKITILHEYPVTLLYFKFSFRVKDKEDLTWFD